MKEAYIDINGIPTHIMCWGKWIEESLDDINEIVICITGNPGLPGFYTQFMNTIYDNLKDKNIPVWLIGHAGHDNPPISSLHQTPKLQDNPDKYNLHGQIEHKLKFIQQYVPENVNIHLIGHSIGAWMALQLINFEVIRNKIKKCYLLFPTLERMAQSKNGKLFNNIAIPLLFIIRIILFLFNALPIMIRTLIISIYLWLFNMPNYFIGTVLKYLTITVMDFVIYLAQDEMKTVDKLDIKLIDDNKNILKLYYGINDGWVPLKYYHEICEKIPDLDAVLDDKNIEHTFVIQSSEQMGSIVAQWITNN